MAESEQWSNYTLLLLEDEELTNSQKELILNGWTKLKNIFDDNWIQTANKWHPLFDYLKDQAFWSRVWLADFGERLSELKDIPHRLKQRLRNETEFYGALAEVEVASNLNRQRCISSFVKENKEGNSSPDIEIAVKPNGRNIFIEVTTKKISADEISERSACNELTAFKHLDLRIYYFCKISKYPNSAAELKQLKQKIQETFEKARNETGYEEFIEPGVIECYISTKENIDRIPIEKRVTKGPPKYVDGTDEIRRIKGTIDDKIKQLIDNKPNVLVIYENNFNLIIPIYYKKSYLNLVTALDGAMIKYPQLSALVIISSFIGTVEKPQIEDGANYTFLKRQDEKGVSATYTLTIKNSSASHPLSKEEYNVIKCL